MKSLKIASAILAVSMLAGVIAGCSKTTNLTTQKFAKACEKMGLEEFDFDGEMPKSRDVEGGFYLAADGDDAEDLLEDFMGDELDKYAAIIGLDDIINSGSVKSFGFAAKVDGYKDLKRLDIDEPEDFEADGAFALQITLDDSYSEDIMEYITDSLDIYDIDTGDLTDKEFYSSQKEGYLRIHISISDFAQMVIDNDDIQEYTKMEFLEDLDDLIGDLTGDIALSVEVNGANVLVVAGFSVNKDAKILKGFIKGFGLTADPTKLPMNEEFAGALVDAAGEAAKEYMEKKAAMIEDNGYGDRHYQDNLSFMVGISMPTQDLQRWNYDGENLKNSLELHGYSVDLQFASNSTSTQAAQIEDMINSGCKLLIIAAIDPMSLGMVLEEAKENNIPVICYDRLIMGTENVDYYVTFDNYLVGVLQASYIVSALDINNNAGPFNIEITAGDPSDNNAMLFYSGAYDFLSPFISAGKINVVSGQTAFEDVATNGWTTANAEARAEDIIKTYYSDGKQIDAWLCSNDSTAWGVTQALEANYTGSYPVITGQDCDLVNVKNIIAGKQAMSVFKETGILVDQTVQMVIAIADGKDVDINDTTTYNNGVKIVPSYLCMPVCVTIDNYKDILVGTGYYSERDLI